MKSKKVLFVVLALVMASFMLACSDKSTDSRKSAGAADTPYEKHLLPTPAEYGELEGGGASYESVGDHFDTPYFKILDVYNMKSTDTLTILSNFAPYEETTEYSCGAASVFMTMNWHGNTDYDERTIAKMAGTTEKGVGIDGLEKFFKKIGWNYERSVNGEYTFDYDADWDKATADFTDWVTGHLKQQRPIIVQWFDYGGHYMNIIGYDTMGTDDFSDDVLIFGDSYDTTDHYQDGYYIMGVERFLCDWFQPARHATSANLDPQPWIIAWPK